VNRAFGSAKTGTAGRSAGGAPQLPAFLTSQSISPFISEELSARLKSPIVYRPKRGGRTAIGYEVTILPRICEAILDARKAGKLRTNQEAMADAAEKLVRAFAKVGIIALVDEATGYQKDRGSDELRRLLEAYVLEEFRPWVKTFPEEFFRQIYRLYGWEYRPGVTQGPRYVGKIIDKYVYQQLPPGIRDALRERNPSVNGQRKHKHFQLLTTDTGNSHLDKQIVAVVTTMKLSDNKAGFERNFKRLYGKQTMLALPEPEKPTS
jgi:hypothetical protein